MRFGAGSTRVLSLLAAGGVLAGHFLAYRVDTAHLHDNGVSHLHIHQSLLPWLAAVVVPLAVLALGRIALEELRTGRRAISFGRLLGTQVALFVAQEAAERLAAGGHPLSLLAAPVLWYGLGAQVLVAGLLLGLVRGVERMVSGAAPLDLAGYAPPRRRPAAPRSITIPPALHPAHSVLLRGPPATS